MIEIIQGDTIKKARKVHRCQWCFATIGIGENYVDSVLKGDEIYHWRSHPRCNALVEKLDMFARSDYELDGERFQEIVRNEYREIAIINPLIETFDMKEFRNRLGVVLTFHGL